jgi:Xaa-Pro aminopeptidase
MPLPPLDIAACQDRQARLVYEMRTLGADLAILATPENIQWLTGVHLGPLFSPAAAIDADGRVTLVLPERRRDVPSAADVVVGYEAQWHSTLRNDQRMASSEALARAIGRRPDRLAVEFSSFGPYLADLFDVPRVDIEPVVYRLRRYKHADELALMRRAIDANRVQYEAARRAIRPGINELEVYALLHEAAVMELREALTFFGQDFQSGSRGGPARDRAAQAGELYILDLGVGCRGYFSDNARTIAVGGRPTEEQERAWSAVIEVFDYIAAEVRPGVSCRCVFDDVQKMLDRHRPWVFNHHLGHGVGLYPHEAPHLNPHWDDTFEVGDVFTAEPGLYHEELRCGLRLEQNYRVTERGVELLSDFELKL